MTIRDIERNAQKSIDDGEGPLFEVGTITPSEMRGLCYLIREHQERAAKRGFTSQATREIDTRVADLIDTLEQNVKVLSNFC